MLNKFQCTQCHVKLESKDGQVRCPRCKRKFPLKY